MESHFSPVLLHGSDRFPGGPHRDATDGEADRRRVPDAAAPRGDSRGAGAMAPGLPLASAAPSSLRRWLLAAVELVPLGILLYSTVAAALQSLGWAVRHDLALFSYLAWAQHEFGLVPYVDFFDMNAPGTHIFYSLVHAVAGNGDLDVRIFDLCFLSLCAVLAGAWLWRHGWRCAVAGGLLLVLGILWLGDLFALQREEACVLPLLCCLPLATRCARMPVVLAAACIGALHGVMASIKPLMLLLLPVFSAGLLLARSPAWNLRRVARHALLVALGSSAGAALVLLLLEWHLRSIGAAAAFHDICRNYWMLYVQIDGDAVVRGFSVRGFCDAACSARLLVKFMVLFPLFLAGFMVAAHAASRSATPRSTVVDVVLLAALAAGCLAYVVLGGKVWQYHAIPFCACASIFGAFLFRRPPDDATPAPARRAAWPAGLSVALLFSLPFTGLSLHRPDEALAAPLMVPTMQAAAYLRDHLREGDLVQPLDVAGGALNAMWRARARLATRFIYDFHFFHHVDTPYIQRLRAEFLASMRERKPRFVVEFVRPKWRPTGPRTERAWAELQTLLATDYAIAARFDDGERTILIHEIKPPRESPP